MKILHTADLHLRDKDIDEAEKCCDFLVETAQQEAVDLTAIAADIFDSRDIKLESASARLSIKTVSRLADIAPVVIITGTPSHDGLAPEILRYAKGEHEIIVAAKPVQFPCATLSERSGFKYLLTLIPTPTKQYFQTNSDIKTADQEISQAMNGLFAGFGAQAHEYNCPHILVGHWNVSGSKLPTGQTLTGQDIEISIDQMMLANPDLICLGHIHMPQQLGDRTFYSGSLYPLNWGENTAHGFYIHELKGKELVKSRFIETPTKRLLRSAANYANNDVQNRTFLEELDVILYEHSPDELKGAYVRLDLTAWQDEAHLIDKEKIRQFYLSGGAIDVDIRIIRVPRQAVRSESVLKVTTLREKIVAMAEIREETVSESVLHKADLLEFGEEKEVKAA